MYSSLYQECHPPYNANTSNTKFLKSHPQPQQAPPTNNSGSADPTKWGPHLWAYLHYSAINYPHKPSKEQKEAMKDWLTCLSATIPCKNCSHHYGKYIQKHTNELDDICSSKNKLFNFLVDIHNKVNKRNGKREISYEEARWIYRKK